MVIIYRNKLELENPYMFSNIEVENTDVQELHNTDQPSSIENTFRPQNLSKPQNNTNQNKNSNCVGNENITVSTNFFLYQL